MVNHLRTLLLNMDGVVTPPSGYPGEEYVPPNFRSKPLRGPVALTYGLLFGSAPDRALLNWRLRSLLAMLHASELSDYVVGLDPRITYLPFNTQLIDTAVLGATITQLSGTQSLSIIGPRALFQAGNRIYFQWKLEVLDLATVRLTQFDPVANTTTVVVQSYTTLGGLPNPITLPGSALQVAFTLGSGSAWTITLLAMPAQNLAGLLTNALSGLDQASEDALFGVDPPEPYRTFRNVWDRHAQLPYKLGGLVLALGYRLNEQTG